MEKPRLLVADDEPFNLEILGEFLGSSGYVLDQVEDGQAAWARLQEGKHYDAVILDRMMPGMDGMEVLRRMKAHEKLSAIPVIFQTAMGDRQHIAEGLSRGAYYYLIKPFDRSVLLAVVGAAVEEGRRLDRLGGLVSDVVGGIRLIQNAQFQFRTLEDADHLAVFTARLTADFDRTVIGLHELLINAIEHGNLGISYSEKSNLIENETWKDEVNRRLADPVLSTRKAVLSIESVADGFAITIADEGKGFDWEKYLEFDPDRAFHSHGRGIALARSLGFQSMEYTAPGNRVRVVLPRK